MGQLPPSLPERNDRRVLVAAAIVSAGVFLADLYVPSDLGVSAIYGLVVLLGLFASSPRYPVNVSIAVTFLMGLGAWLAHWDETGAYHLANRGLALIGIWVSAGLVTGYRRVGEALDRSAKSLADTKFAIDQAAIVAMTDVTGRITYVNDKFCEISKYSRDELLGQDHRIINSGHHSKEFIRDLWQTIANGGIWRGELRNRAKDGSFYWVDTTIVPFLNDRGKPYQYMAIRSDITERKHSEALLRERAALARLGEMAAVVAHEVKNPLAGIRGSLQVIGGRMPAESRDRSVVGDIVDRLDSLNNIVDDMLVFARPREPKLAAVVLDDLLRSTAALLKKDPAHSATHVNVSDAHVVVRADAEQLQLVLVNLLLNAAQATPNQGQIRVAVSTNNGVCRIAISDNGPGIPNDVRERIFEPFFTTKHRGTGLGLPTAKRVIEQHGGSIEIQCPQTGGTVVTVSLPLDSQAHVSRAGGV
jgi:PAS domain S-box-containing protein